MNVVEIPVTPQPQRFRVALSNIIYTWRIYWLVPAQCWVLDIFDIEEKPLIEGIPLITGVDLLAQHQHIIKGGLFVISDQLPPDTVPDFTHLGSTGHIYFLPPAA